MELEWNEAVLVLALERHEAVYPISIRVHTCEESVCFCLPRSTPRPT